MGHEVDSYLGLDEIGSPSSIIIIIIIIIIVVVVIVIIIIIYLIVLFRIYLLGFL